MNKSLDDRSFIAQTVNYANNEGVLWCVLTNGLVYRVYKTNEPVGMEQKLLFEVDLRDGEQEQGGADSIRSLRMLTPEAVRAGKLDAWGEEVFTDGRVRAALSSLAANPPASLLSAVTAELEGTAISPDKLSESLVRILGQFRPAGVPGPVAGPSPAVTRQRPASASTVATYDVAWHKRKAPAALGDLFDRLDAAARALGTDVVQRPQKHYIGFFARKRSFFTVQFQKTKLRVHLSIPPDEAQPWDASAMRDVSKIGHYGMGDTEFVLTSPDQLGQLEGLVREAYTRNRQRVAG